MNTIRSLLALLLSFCLLISLAGCAQPAPIETTPQSPGLQTQPTEASEPILFSEPEEPSIPQIPPQDQITAELPRTPQDWVFTNYSQTISWRDSSNQYCAVSLELPALTPAADFAVAYNRYVKELGDALLLEAEQCRASGYAPSTLSVTYETALRDELLFISINRIGFDTVCTRYIHVFDLEDRQMLHRGEISDELLDLDYPAFLMVTQELIQQEFIIRYEAAVKEEESKAYANDPYLTQPLSEFVENYYQTLEALPYQVMGLSQAVLFPDENGQLLLYCQIPSPESDSTPPELIPFDLTEVSLPTQAQAYGWLLDLQHHVDGAYADAYSGILLEAFLSDDDDFVRYAAVEGADSMDRILGFLAYAVSPTQLPTVKAECQDLLREDDLTPKERSFVELLLDALPESN